MFAAAKLELIAQRGGHSEFSGARTTSATSPNGSPGRLRATSDQPVSCVPCAGQLRPGAALPGREQGAEELQQPDPVSGKGKGPRARDGGGGCGSLRLRPRVWHEVVRAVGMLSVFGGHTPERLRPGAGAADRAPFRSGGFLPCGANRMTVQPLVRRAALTA